MLMQSRFLKRTAVLCAALTALLTFSVADPAFAGDRNGAWRDGAGGNSPADTPSWLRNERGGGYRSGSGDGYRPAYGRDYRNSHDNRYYGNRYHGGYDRGPDAGAAVAAGIIGLATGAIAAGALSQRRHAAVNCTHYRSYNPRTGTYIGRSGRRYAC